MRKQPTSAISASLGHINVLDLEKDGKANWNIVTKTCGWEKGLTGSRWVKGLTGQEIEKEDSFYWSISFFFFLFLYAFQRDERR